MAAELTVRQKILVAAVALGEEVDSFTVEDLIVRAWQLYPEAFSLRTYHAKYPDSNRVLAKLSGVDGLCGLGWLEHTDQRMYRVTRKGRVVARQLIGMGAASGAMPSLVAANEAADEAEELAAKSASKAEPKVETKVEIVPKVAAKSAASRSRAKAEKVEAKPAKPVVELTAHEIQAVGVVARSEALRKFLRGSPLTFADACAFWAISPARPAGSIQKIEAAEDLFRRVVETFGAEGTVDTRLPPLSTCYGLLNLHRLMVGRFSREIEALKVQLAAG